MAKLTLDDGRVIDLERKPTVQEKVLAQTQYRRAFKTSPQDMGDVMASLDWMIALPLFITLHRAGVGERMPDLMDDDRLNYWYARSEVEPGEQDDDESAEGEQSPHPPVAPEADAAAAVTPPAPPSTD